MQHCIKAHEIDVSEKYTYTWSITHFKMTVTRAKQNNHFDLPKIDTAWCNKKNTVSLLRS